MPVSHRFSKSGAMQATFRPLSPSSAAIAKPAGPAPITATSSSACDEVTPRYSDSLHLRCFQKLRRRPEFTRLDKSEAARAQRYSDTERRVECRGVLRSQTCPFPTSAALGATACCIRTTSCSLPERVAALPQGLENSARKAGARTERARASGIGLRVGEIMPVMRQRSGAVDARAGKRARVGRDQSLAAGRGLA
jgi:hypothetical protein